MNQQEFIRALTAFLKKSGKLKVPKWVDTIKPAKHKELAHYNESLFYIEWLPQCCTSISRAVLGWLQDQHLWGHQRNHIMSSHFSRAPRVWPVRSSKPWKG
eukprot:bmy_14037T0